MTFVLVAPPLDGPVSGGTLFNRAIVRNLRASGHSVDVVDALEDANGFAWVDTLHLDAAAPHWATRPLGLLAHYLPSLVEHPRDLTPDELRPEERSALRGARAVLCPSPWMAETLRRLGATGEVRVLQPPLPDGVGVGPRPDGAVRLVMVGATTPGKGQHPLLTALAAEPPSSPWSLDIVGNTRTDVAYAAACQEAARELPVRFVGPLASDACLRLVAGSHGLVSSSIMESYGMAIAEAQACGVPVLALEGGNVGAMVQRPGSVGAATVPELAEAVRAHARDPEPLLDAARQSPRAPAADWDAAALLRSPV